jgi:predicted O-methyltransferase YrrM
MYTSRYYMSRLGLNERGEFLIYNENPLKHMPWYGYHRYLTDCIRAHRCRRIMEIGVYDGDNALDMIKAASENHRLEDVEYYGFDYFENYGEAQITRKLATLGCKIHLCKGDTMETLPQAKLLPLMDLIFIDAGKSYTEAQNDWHYSSSLMHLASVVFIHNYDFQGVHRMVNGIPKEDYTLTILREEHMGLVAQIEKKKISQPGLN